MRNRPPTTQHTVARKGKGGSQMLLAIRKLAVGQSYICDAFYADKLEHPTKQFEVRELIPNKTIRIKRTK